jgi:hypothetical protein
MGRSVPAEVAWQNNRLKIAEIELISDALAAPPRRNVTLMKALVPAFGCKRCSTTLQVSRRRLSGCLE